ncbi:DUF1016 N-terminal domain-containing protein [Arthrobacter sp. ISL-28]|uniref:DUF1016 N-terminal domain-containing protein n=1 Tax=Arthrobacter sp. ISL-28 TaxID=2819108 RepID=UPI00288C1328|nr:DUF1016 N-terminal domain-containing protein [Arthrobacter sp. ISL-28]
MLGELKNRVRAARTTALRTVNTQLIELHRSIGRTILERQEVESWGSGVMGRLARVCCSLAGTNCATACCTIAPGPHHSAVIQGGDRPAILVRRRGG